MTPFCKKLALSAMTAMAMAGACLIHLLKLLKQMN